MATLKPVLLFSSLNSQEKIELVEKQPYVLKTESKSMTAREKLCKSAHGFNSGGDPGGPWTCSWALVAPKAGQAATATLPPPE